MISPEDFGAAVPTRLFESKTAQFNLLALLAVMIFTVILMLVAAALNEAFGYDGTEIAITGIITAGGVGGGVAAATTWRNVKTDAPMRQAQANAAMQGGQGTAQPIENPPVIH